MKKVSYQGVQGAYSQSAAKKFFGEEIDTFGTNSFEDALNSAQEGKTPSDTNYSILPIENSKKVWGGFELSVAYTFPNRDFR